MRKIFLFAITFLFVFSLNLSTFAQKYQTLDEQVAFAFDQNFTEWKADIVKTFKAISNWGHVLFGN